MPRYIARGDALCAPRPSVSRFPSIRVGESRTGRGVFVRDGVRRGDPILAFRGRSIDFAGTLAKGERECDALQVGPDLYLDLEEPGRFVNHSCEPNSGVRDGVVLVALRDLAPGEEVLFDYSTTMAENHWTLECLCGSSRCRRTIRDFHLLAPEEKMELIRQEIVPAFILALEAEGTMPARDTTPIDGAMPVNGTGAGNGVAPVDGAAPPSGAPVASRGAEGRGARGRS